ncbi:hypothetical protein ACFU8Q_03715 [Streptomyces sp. NPDC057543]|uniref:hypothetical protein n=1 Tax=Streptomyces sp. NPDC057543 TaxID=3346163 RepID=UPI0036B27EFF
MQSLALIDTWLIAYEEGAVELDEPAGLLRWASWSGPRPALLLLGTQHFGQRSKVLRITQIYWPEP